MNERQLFCKLYKEHHLAWGDTKRIENCQNKKSELLKLWKDELLPHFKEEEVVLFPILNKNGMSEDVNELVREHNYFYGLVDKISKSDDCDKYIIEFCSKLKQHIRKEENVMGCFHEDPYCNKTKTKKMENKIQFEPEINGFDEELINEDYSNFRLLGIGKPTKKQVEKKAKRKEKKAIRKSGRKERREEAKEERKGKTLLGRVANIVQKYNPALVVIRSSVITGIRVNIFGIARRLYPALLSDAELKARNFDLENAKRAREALKKAHKIYFGIGGRSSSFDIAIKRGYDKPVFKTKKMRKMKSLEKKSSFASDKMVHRAWGVYPASTPLFRYGLEQNKGNGIELDINPKLDLNLYENYSNVADPASVGVEAYILAGLPVLGTIVTAISSSTKSNPYAQGSPEHEKLQGEVSKEEAAGDLTPPQVDEEELEKIQQDAQEEEQQFGAERKELEDEDGGGDEKILGIPKTGFYIGASVLGVTLLGLGIYFATRKK